MLLQLNNYEKKELEMLLTFARQHNIQLNLLDETESNYSLPGKPLSDNQLNELILNSRKSVTVTLQSAHQIIREAYMGNKVHP